MGLRRRSRLPVAPRPWWVPGPPQDLVSWWAQDEDFAILYALYLLAVAASAFGVAASLLIRRDFRRSEEAASTTPFRAYLKALVAYFVIQLFANLAAFLGFTTWRCEHHTARSCSRVVLHARRDACSMAWRTGSSPRNVFVTNYRCT